MPDGPIELLTAGALGTPQVAVCETLWYRPASYFLPDWRGNWAGEGGGPTLGHGIHQIDLLLHLMGQWDSLTAKSARIARPVEFEDVSMAVVTFASGAIGSVVTSLLSPRELSRIRIDTTDGTLEVDHVYGYRDADWSWFSAPDTAAATNNGRDPGPASRNGHGASRRTRSPTSGQPPPGPTCRPTTAAQIDQLIDDLLAGRQHDTTLASTRPTIEFVTALYASSLEGDTVRRSDLTPDQGFYSPPRRRAARRTGLQPTEPPVTHHSRPARAVRQQTFHHNGERLQPHDNRPRAPALERIAYRPEACTRPRGPHLLLAMAGWDRCRHRTGLPLRRSGLRARQLRRIVVRWRDHTAGVDLGQRLPAEAHPAGRRRLHQSQSRRQGEPSRTASGPRTGTSSPPPLRPTTPLT